MNLHRKDELTDPLANVGEIRRVFDNKEWAEAGYDQPEGNDRFYHPATVLRAYRSNDQWNDALMDVRFHHNDRVSRGHFTHNGEVLRRGKEKAR